VSKVCKIIFAACVCLFFLNVLGAFITLSLIGAGIIPFEGPPRFFWAGLGISLTIVSLGGIPLAIKEFLLDGKP